MSGGPRRRPGREILNLSAWVREGACEGRSEVRTGLDQRGLCGVGQTFPGGS